jgi:hypothetical protein
MICTEVVMAQRNLEVLRILLSVALLTHHQADG